MKNQSKWLMPIFVTLVTLILFKSMMISLTDTNRPAPLTRIGGMNLFSNCAESTPVGADDFSAPQRIHPVRISGKVSFANELVPLEDQEVRERFDKELLVNTFWHSNTMLDYKLANKYFKEIEAILEANGVPSDFKYLAVAESGLRNVTSPAGAGGFWQFLKATGLEYGLEITSEVDERNDYEKATVAACKYLKDAKKKFGSWTLAAASYNAGVGKIDQRLTEQKVSNYYDLYLNTETSRYVFRILSYKMLFENPKKFGFYIKPSDLYEPFEFTQIQVSKSIPDLAQFALENGTTYKMLKIVNPWLISTSLTISSGKTYTIKIPTGYIDESYYEAQFEQVEEEVIGE